jgi:poly(3-hydroxybutyrate) depolymerase
MFAPRRVVAVSLLAVLWSLFGADPANADGSLSDRSYTSPADGAPRSYEVWIPSGYDRARPLPAILFLHGRGGSMRSFQQPGYESGADASGTILIFWEGRLQREIGAFSTLYVDGANGIPDETDVLACLADAMAAFAIDPARVHLAGFSQGGKGALLVGLKNPDRFASLVDGAGPSDAFEGQAWSPGFPDFAAAAGGDVAGASGKTLALWYAQSARFLLPNARNLAMGLFHGTADTVVPDSASLFPYRNTHHIADVPGFSDARGRTPTLAELHAADPGGYLFSAAYPAGVGHDEEAVLPASALFAFVSGKSRPIRPPRVVARTFEAAEKSFYWIRLSRTTPLDGTRVGVTGDLVPGGAALETLGAPGITLVVAAAGLDPATGFSVTLAPESAGALRLSGSFGNQLRITRDGVLLVPDADYRRDGTDVLLPIPTLSYPSRLLVAPEPGDPIAPGDLLVPAFVDAPGLLGARFRSEIVVANLSPVPARLEALLAGGPDAPLPVEIDVPASATLLVRSPDLLARLGLAQAASPLRLRVIEGEPEKVFVTERVFNDGPGGTYGLSFPVQGATASTLGPGEAAEFFGGTAGHPSRTNLSLFAPFGAARAEVTVVDRDGKASPPVPVSLAPLQRVQLNDLLASAAAPARATVSVLSGRVQAYATVIDLAANNDPFRSPPFSWGAPGSSWTVPAVAAAPGRAGAVFTSDLYLAVPGNAGGPIPVTITFLPRGGGKPLAATTWLVPGTARVIEDVVTTLFPAAAPGAGALALDAPSAIEVLAVTRSDSAAGPASQDLSAVRAGGEVTPGTPGVFVGLAESPGARSNLVLVNRGLAATTVGLSACAEDGWRGSMEVEVASGETRQFDSVLGLFGTSPSSAAALVVTPRSGAVFATAVRIDNRSNDPVGLDPIAAPAAGR